MKLLLLVNNFQFFCFLQARVSLPGGLAMHSLPGRQVCIDTGLPHFFHMPPSAHAHAPAPSSPQLPPSPHSSHTHKVGAGCRRTHCRGTLVSSRCTKKGSRSVHLILCLPHCLHFLYHTMQCIKHTVTFKTAAGYSNDLVTVKLFLH